MTLTIPPTIIALVSSAAFLVIAGTLRNLFYALHTPAQWVAFVERNPRVAHIIKPSSQLELIAIGVLTKAHDLTATLGKQGLPLPEAMDSVPFIPCPFPLDPIDPPATKDGAA